MNLGFVHVARGFVKKMKEILSISIPRPHFPLPSR